MAIPAAAMAGRGGAGAEFLLSWWDHRLVVRRVVQWANNVARGRDDRRQTLTKAEFVEGGTIGPALATTR